MRHRTFRIEGALLAISLSLAGTDAVAAPVRPSLQDSFRLGDAGGVLCQVQSRSIDPALKSMFDRAYAIACRDAATPIGNIYALRKDGGAPEARLPPLEDCTAAPTESLPDAGQAKIALCRRNGLDYRRMTVESGRTLFVAEGVAAYDQALRLGLRTIVADRILPGTISVATVSGSDAAAFARTQAGTLDADRALSEGYRRNNSGSYAEAAEFFDALARGGSENSPQGRRRLGEYIVNRALQKSNLGAFAEADALFDQADRIATADPVQLRLRRNFRAMHLVNQRRLPDALALLAQPLAAVTGAGADQAIEIDAETADLMNSGAPLARRLGGADALNLSPEERMAILDAQALALKGTALRLSGDLSGARPALRQALSDLLAIRQGRVVSIAGLRAQTMAELSAVAEAEGQRAEAGRLLRDGVALLSGEYPDSIALGAAKARLAAFLARGGDEAGAMTLFGEVIATFSANEGSTSGFVNLLTPYFELLARRPDRVAEMFLASETLVRPGVADTQAVLARELSGGRDEAATLFRQSLNISREIERNRIESARLAAIEGATVREQAELAAIRGRIAELEADQVATLARLSQYPRYRAISTRALTLDALQKALRPGEAYLKTAIVGDQVYMILARRDSAAAWRAAIDAPALQRVVGKLRDTISTVENGQNVTYPFDVALARALYADLLGPGDGQLQGVDHLIFEPDGALLQLPIDLLVTADGWPPGADAFDFRGVAWLGRRSRISTAVSARAFRDVRDAPASAAGREYLGLGANIPMSPFVRLTRARSVSGEGGIDCAWPVSQWDQPIAATELYAAQRRIGGQANVIVGREFTDSTLLAAGDLDQYRVLHFATHGLVSAPRAQCPARPALLTSFGSGNSDGLLSFREIFDLRLDADLIILSACDTAGKATVSATREAGLSGGGSALDGLVRAFVGAGGRSVLASHWPAPDDFRATERLIGGLFEAAPGTGVAAALQAAQLRLMDDADTSHPYYWAGFAVIGDGAQPVLRAR